MKINTFINTLIIVFALVGTNSFAQQNQTILKSEIAFKSNFFSSTTLTTFLKVEQTDNEFILTSPKNADVRIFGGFKARLGRMLGKSPKKGIFVTIICEQKGDSLIGFMKTPFLEKFKFKGLYKNDSLSGKIIKNDTIVGNIIGIKSQETSIDYNHLFPKIIDITQNNIYSKKVLQTDEWKKFRKELKKTLDTVQDDIELYLSFKLLSQNLPFSHYYLFIQETTEKVEGHDISKNPEKKVPTVVYEKKNKTTGYLKIKNFGSSKKELARILLKIIKENPKNLIIDLRNNGGGGIDAAFEFGKYIMNKNVEIGYFVTNELQYTGFDIDLFKKLPVAKPETTEEFIERLKQGKGAKLVFNNPGAPVYAGNIFVLTNDNTGSTCEPIVYVLKESGRATIIGEKTAGAMLSGALFDISGKYKLFLPIADFYTYDGVRLEGVGVAPNIETTSENALNKALSIIKNQE